MGDALIYTDLSWAHPGNVGYEVCEGRFMNILKRTLAQTMRHHAVCFDSGCKAHARGDWEGAIADFTKAIDIKPNFAVAYNARGAAKEGNRDWEGAIADYTRALELQPAFNVAYNNRGIAKRAKGDLDGAIGDSTKAIELQPTHAAYFSRGNAKSDKGDLDGAIADYTHAIELHPYFAAAYTYRGDVKKSKGDLDGANADHAKAAQLKYWSGKVFNTGCSMCGGAILAKFSVQKLKPELAFLGTGLQCTSCKRSFLESSVILDDNRTIQPIHNFVESSIRQRQISLPGAAVIMATPEPPRTTEYKCILGRPFHTEIGIDFLQHFLLECILLLNTLTFRTMTERLSIEIDGYSEDKREIWQIPELTSFFYKMHKQIQFPSIAFWLTGNSLKLFLKTVAAGMPQEEKSQVLQMSSAIHTTIVEKKLGGVMAVGGLSDELHITRWIMLESVSKTRAVLQNAFKGEDDIVRRIQSQSELCNLLSLPIV